MKYIEELKEATCKELERFAKNGEITASNLDKIQKLVEIVKNLDKIEMLEGDGYSEDWMGEGRAYGTSYARGRRGAAKRDTMGRYSRDEGDYSKTDAKEHMLDKLGELMDGADPNEREALKRAMREIERA